MFHLPRNNDDDPFSAFSGNSQSLLFQSKEENAEQSYENRRLMDLILSFRGNIRKYIDYLGNDTTWQQDEFFETYAEGHPKIAIRSGKGPGKTHASAICMSHWNLTNPDSMLIVTAPTYRQCKDGWLSRLEKIINGPDAHPDIKKIFNIRGSGYGILGAKNSVWGCQLITARNKESFQGIHEEYLAFLEDESAGVDRYISEAAQETLKNREGTYLYVKVGNPNTRNCAFFDSFKADSGWKCIHWNAEETPEGDHFSQDRNKEIADQFGKDSDIYRIAVLGEFPETDANCLINDTDLDICTTQEALNNALAVGDTSKKQIGQDLARYGGDRNSIAVVWGNVLVSLWAKKVPPLKAVDRANLMQMEMGWNNSECTYVVDATGIGQAVVDELGGDYRRGRKVHEFNSHNKAVRSDLYADKITEAWAYFAKLVRKHQVYLGERINYRLREQLLGRTYSITSDGLIKIQSKDEYKKENGDENGDIGKSPDEADGVVMGFYPYATHSTRVCAG